MRVADLGAFAEERIGFVEEEHGAGAFGLVEGGRQVLLGLADPLRHQARQVDHQQVGMQCARNHFGRQCLASARQAREQEPQAAHRPLLARKAPVVQHLLLQLHALHGAAQRGFTRRAQHQVSPGGAGHHAAGEAVVAARGAGLERGDAARQRRQGTGSQPGCQVQAQLLQGVWPDGITCRQQGTVRRQFWQHAGPQAGLCGTRKRRRFQRAQGPHAAGHRGRRGACEYDGARPGVEQVGLLR